MTTILGIDIGGTGIRVRPSTWTRERSRRIVSASRLPRVDRPGMSLESSARSSPTSTPGPVGCTFPAVMQHGVALTASNVDKSWIGTDAEALFETEVKRPFVVINDADAAGIAEVEHGRAGITGTIVLITLGTGIGKRVVPPRVCSYPTPSSVISRSGAKPPKKRASEKVREDHDLSWDKWAKRVNEVLATSGARLSRPVHHRRRRQQEEREVPASPRHPGQIVPAQLLNEAGIVGAAIAASRSTS